MNTEETINTKYKNLAIRKANELLFRREDALRLIEDFKESGTIILGMNFWKREDNNIIESNSTDYSAINQGPKAHEKTIGAAKDLIKDSLPDNADYVSFV